MLITVRYASVNLLRISISISRAMPASSVAAITWCSSTFSPRRKALTCSCAFSWLSETSEIARLSVSPKEAPGAFAPRPGAPAPPPTPPTWPAWPMPADWVIMLRRAIEIWPAEMDGMDIGSGLHVEASAAHDRLVAAGRAEHVAVGQRPHRPHLGEEAPLLGGEHAPQLRVGPRRGLDGERLRQLGGRRDLAGGADGGVVRRRDRLAVLAVFDTRAGLRVRRAEHARQRSDSVQVHRSALQISIDRRSICLADWKTVAFAS